MNHKQRYKIKKISNQNTKKNPENTFALFNCTGEMGMGNSGSLKSSLILFLLCKESAKKINGVHTLTAEPPSSPTKRPSALLARPLLPPPSACTLWMTPFLHRADFN